MRLIGGIVLIAVFAIVYQIATGRAQVAPVPAPTPELPSLQALIPDPRVDELQAQIAVLEDQLNETNQAPAVAIQPVEVPPPVEAARTVDTSQPAHGCVATPGNENGSSPSLTVSDGHLLTVQWYYDGGPQEQSVLTSGAWQPKAGVRVGAHWDYPACDEVTVVNQAVASNGNVTDPGNGFVAA